MPAGEADDPALFVLARETRRAKPATTRSGDVVVEPEGRVVIRGGRPCAVADEPEGAGGAGSEEGSALGLIAPIVGRAMARHGGKGSHVPLRHRALPEVAR
jgi:hypothetical protein